jgi:hypothetical protein
LHLCFNGYSFKAKIEKELNYVEDENNGEVRNKAPDHVSRHELAYDT